jgi:type IV pilus assembly protein PilE
MKSNRVRPTFAPRRKLAAGFTLLEVMVVCVIVGVLAAVALPSYFDYITRGRINEATTALSNFRQLYEQYFLDNRTYAGACAAYSPQINGQVLSTNGTADFAVACVETAATYTITATGQGVMNGFVYSITNTGLKASVGPVGWAAPAGNCWLVRRSGDCE